IGLGFAGTFDPSLGEPELPTGRLARALAALAFLGAGGLGESLHALLRPVVTSQGLVFAARSLADESARVLIVGVRLAAPAVVAALVANLAAAVASRAAPALNVFSVALALVLVVTAIVLISTAPLAARELLMVGRRVAEAVTATVH